MLSNTDRDATNLINASIVEEEAKLPSAAEADSEKTYTTWQSNSNEILNPKRMSPSAYLKFKTTLAAAELLQNPKRRGTTQRQRYCKVACIECKRRGKRCSEQRPCPRCTQNGTECIDAPRKARQHVKRGPYKKGHTPNRTRAMSPPVLVSSTDESPLFLLSQVASKIEYPNNETKRLLQVASKIEEYPSNETERPLTNL